MEVYDIRVHKNDGKPLYIQHTLSYQSAAEKVRQLAKDETIIYIRLIPRGRPPITFSRKGNSSFPGSIDFDDMDSALALFIQMERRHIQKKQEREQRLRNMLLGIETP